jgi:hypothetical protein
MGRDGETLPIREARMALAVYQFGRGNGVGLRDWWRDKRYAQKEAEKLFLVVQQKSYPSAARLRRTLVPSRSVNYRMQ